MATFTGIELPADLWLGWYRLAHTRRWLLAAAERTEAECRRVLERYGAERSSRGGDTLVREPGRGDPNGDGMQRGRAKT